MLLVQCERLFTNEIEQQVFEDQTRAIFGVKVVFYFFLMVLVLLRLIYLVERVQNLYGRQTHRCYHQAGELSWHLAMPILIYLTICLGSNCDCRPKKPGAA
jgi:hypothetical protein